MVNLEYFLDKLIAVVDVYGTLYLLAEPTSHDAWAPG
jgi:hypothetical protein